MSMEVPAFRETEQQMNESVWSADVSNKLPSKHCKSPRYSLQMLSQDNVQKFHF